MDDSHFDDLKSDELFSEDELGDTYSLLFKDENLCGWLSYVCIPK